MLTNSSITTYRRCPRDYYYRYILQRVPVVTSSALTLGTLVHQVLENKLLGGDYDMQLTTVEEAKAKAMTGNWTKPEGKIDKVEHVFECTFEGYKYTGKIDAVFDEYIVEHKTTSLKIDGYSDYWQQLNVDTQICLYLYAMKMTDCLYDVLKKPGFRLSKKDLTMDDFYNRCNDAIKEDLPGYYQQRVISKSYNEIQQGMRELNATSELIEKDGVFPRFSNSCNGKFGRCTYLNVCSGMQSIDDDNSFRTKFKQHEEL